MLYFMGRCTFIIDLVANLRELYLRNYECVYVRTDLYMKLHTELGRLWFEYTKTAN